MVVWDKAATKGKAFFQLIPGPLIAVILSVGCNEIFIRFFPSLSVLEKHLVELPFRGGMGEFFYTLTTPDWTQMNRFAIYKISFILAIVASIETLLSVEAADKLDEEGRTTSKNRELLAQGIGNTLCGLAGGLPVTAVIVRTSANAAAGAKSKLSAILHGLWLFICVVAISSLLNLIPLSCLAAVLILVGYKLTKPQIIKKMYQKGWNQFIPFVVTISAILFTDLLIGIIIGMIVGFIFVMRSNIHKSIVMVNEGNNYLIRFYKDVSFVQKNIMKKMLNKIPSDSNLVIDGSKSVFVDDDIEELIEDFIKRAKLTRINVELKRSPLALSPMFKAE
jgi:MFS superfamily sulfate permease-like transporter